MCVLRGTERVARTSATHWSAAGGAPLSDGIRSLGYPVGESERGKPAGRALAWRAKPHRSIPTPGTNYIRYLLRYPLLCGFGLIPIAR